MDMTFCPDPSHFFMPHVMDSSGDPVIMTREAVNPALEFDEALEAFQTLSTVLQAPVNIFTKVFESLPMDGLRMSLQNFLDNVPDEEAFEALAFAETGSVEQALASTASHTLKLQFARKALVIPDEELKALVNILQIDIQFDQYILYAGNRAHEFSFVAIPIPADALSMTQEQLESTIIQTEGVEVGPDDVDSDVDEHQPGTVEARQPAKRVVH